MQHRHRLKIDNLVFDAHVVPAKDDLIAVNVVLVANHMPTSYDDYVREAIDQWLMGPGGVISQATAIATPMGRCVSVFDHQHIMTT